MNHDQAFAHLPAYYDGELPGDQRRRLEEHLAACVTCQAELAELQGLTGLLRAVPQQQRVTPPARFTAHVGLRLAGRPQATPWATLLERGWRMVPFGILGTWAFVQAVLIVSGVVWLILQTGVADGTMLALLTSTAGLPLGRVPVDGWWDAIRLTGRVFGSFPVQLLVLNLGSVLAAGIAFWSWMASWFVRQRVLQTGGKEIS